MIDSREFGVASLEVPEMTVPLDTSAGFDTYAIWTAEYGPTNQIASAVSSIADVRCELRNAPPGVAGTHAADCMVLFSLVP